MLLRLEALPRRQLRGLGVDVLPLQEVQPHHQKTIKHVPGTALDLSWKFPAERDQADGGYDGEDAWENTIDGFQEYAKYIVAEWVDEVERMF